jgi:hypothetical protein
LGLMRFYLKVQGLKLGTAMTHPAISRMPSRRYRTSRTVVARCRRVVTAAMVRHRPPRGHRWKADTTNVRSGWKGDITSRPG